MLSIQFQADDIHDSLARTLDKMRVAGLRITAIHAEIENGLYIVSLKVGPGDRDLPPNIESRIEAIIGVSPVAQTRMFAHA